MKKCLAIFALVVVVLGIAACGKQEAESAGTNKEISKHHEIVTKATTKLKDYWTQFYKEQNIETDGYFEIKNTRIITVKENEIDVFDDVAYIIEYELYTDYMGTAPYYENCGINNNVVVYKNGTMDVASNLIRTYRRYSYQTDYSSFIKAIDDYHGYYNCVEKLK